MEMDLWNNEVGRELGRKLKERGVEDDDSYAEEIFNQIDKLIHEPQRDD
ncbi:MAG: hypothetical protein QME32_08185 [Endomicrobiia bacterium]|nr:hypothetical protein [Endomicrobiia bacterium]